MLIKDRLSTRNILRRKNMHLDSYNCVLCNESVEEIAEHLFLQCSFAKDCWSIINLDTPPHMTFPQIVDHIKTKLQFQFFMLAVILMCWTIWTARNDLIFKGIPPDVGTSRGFFLKEILLLVHRVKSRNSISFEQWTQTLV